MQTTLPILNNIAIGILTKVNELASRYGLTPTDFVAEYKDELKPNPALGGELDQTGNSILHYTILPSDPGKLKSFERMLETLGISNDSGKLVATDDEIMQALDNALDLAPRARTRS